MKLFTLEKVFDVQVYINLATGVGMEEKKDVAYAHKKVLQGSSKKDADEFLHNPILQSQPPLLKIVRMQTNIS